MRRTLAVSALAALALAPQAHAAPTGGVADGAGAHFLVTTAAGQTYDLQVVAALPTKASTSSAPKLRVHVVQQDTKRSGDLPASAVSVGTDKVTLAATLGGVPLRVTWAVDPGAVAVSFGELSSDSQTADGWMVAGKGATAQMTFGGLRCTTTNAIVGSVLGYETDSYGSALSNGLGLNLKRARCGSPPSTNVPPLP
jgi:hypothetical protein